MKTLFFSDKFYMLIYTSLSCLQQSNPRVYKTTLEWLLKGNKCNLTFSCPWDIYFNVPALKLQGSIF